MKILRIIAIFLILFESTIIFTDDKNNISENEIQVVSRNFEERSILSILEEIDRNENIDINKIEQNNKYYNIEIQIICDKEQFIELIENLKDYEVKTYELNLKDKIIEGTISLKYYI